MCFSYILFVEQDLQYLISVVQFYGKLGPGYSFDVAFKDPKSNRVYEGLFWYAEDNRVESALVLEDEALEEKYRGNFKTHPDYKKYLDVLIEKMPDKKILESESKKIK